MKLGSIQHQEHVCILHRLNQNLFVLFFVIRNIRHNFVKLWQNTRQEKVLAKANLDKWLSIRLRTKQLCVQIRCCYLNFRYCACLKQEFLDIQETTKCRFNLKCVRGIVITYSSNKYFQKVKKMFFMSPWRECFKKLYSKFYLF